MIEAAEALALALTFGGVAAMLWTLLAVFLLLNMRPGASLKVAIV